MTTIHFTFDYELFVNDHTGDIDHCLIIPTDELMKMFDRHEVKVTFFIDMAYAYRLTELMNTYPSLKNDYDKFCRQVRDIARHGHKIALHLHPQWFYAEYDGEKWTMDFDHYKLSDMPLDEADSKFDDCYKMLCEISGCKVDTFRAGGFSIQGYKGFYNAMRRNGIVNDSSALVGERQITSLHSYDYSSVKSPDSYRFGDNIIMKDRKGMFTEYPIATRRMPVFLYILYRLKWKYFTFPRFAVWGNGGDNSGRQRKESLKNLKRRLVNGVNIYGSVDGTLGQLLPPVIEKSIRNNVKDLTFLGHPKLASMGSIAIIEKLILRYKDHVEFKQI